MLPLEQLAGHGKNPRAWQKSLPLEQCSNTTTYLQDSGASNLPPKKWGELKQSNLLKSSRMSTPSGDRNIQDSPAIEKSGKSDVLGVTTQKEVLREPARDLSTRMAQFGSKQCELLVTEGRPAELEADICLGEPLSQPVTRSFSESSISTVASKAAKKSPLEHKFKVGDRVTREPLRRGEGRIVDRKHPEPGWVYVDWLGNLNPKSATPYHVGDLVKLEPEKVLPLEQTIAKSSDRHEQNLIDQIATLEARRDSIRRSGPIAPTGVWIEYGKISKRDFRQGYYRSNKAIFTTKRKGSFAKRESGLVKRFYLGEENSQEVKTAGEAISRRNELMRIEKEIEIIERKL